ncbi:MAG TPA: alpha/beta hydrolase [Kofleriaceae bacterium]|nr:alpha/beta hydrolase [Kofleriaceae bacterium]
MSIVLAIHSGGFTSRQWKKLVQRLAPRYEVITPDLLGYGPEPWPIGKPFHFAQDVAHVAAMLDEPAHLVGHSYGGFIAAQLALAHPARVRSLALYEPVTFGVLDQPGDLAVRASIDRLPAYRSDGDRADEAWLAAFVDWWQGAGAWAALAEPTRQAFRAVAWKVSQEVASLAADRTSSARYATIAVPTLLLGGERTQPAELHVLRELAALLPHATLELLPELGHMGPITAPDRVNDAILRHLQTCDP